VSKPLQPVEKDLVEFIEEQMSLAENQPSSEERNEQRGGFQAKRES
jgi:hypothetical protein